MRPAGPFSIGRALEIPLGAVNDDLRLAVDAIDRVHGVGHLPRIPLEFRSQLGMHGRFDFDETTGEPIRILIDRRASHRAFVALHEIGHFLDLAAFGDGPRFGTTLNTSLDVWLLTITESEAHRTLVTLHTHRPMARLFRFLKVDELWSRSYAQFIALNSGHPELLDGVRAGTAAVLEDLHIPLQWEDNDFENIAKAIGALFIELGWCA